MGYYTSYGLDYKADEGYQNEEGEFIKALVEISKDSEGNDDSEILELTQAGGVWAKLYDLSDWITELAPKFPHLLICLSGNGEDTQDIWEERWKGNDHELQQSVIPPFENPNLKTLYEIKNNY